MPDTMRDRLLAFARANGATEDEAKSYLAGVVAAIDNPDWAHALLRSLTLEQTQAALAAADAVVDGVPE